MGVAVTGFGMAIISLLEVLLLFQLAAVIKAADARWPGLQVMLQVRALHPGAQLN